MPKEAENLLEVEKGNVTIIANYLIAFKREGDVKDSTRFNHYRYLIRFAQKMNKSFAQMTSEDISTYMAGFEKSEDEDPCHKWKGTYNLFAQIISPFFKWFHSPMSPPKERPKPTYRKRSTISKMMKYTKQEGRGIKDESKNMDRWYEITVVPVIKGHSAQWQQGYEDGWVDENSDATNDSGAPYGNDPNGQEDDSMHCQTERNICQVTSSLSLCPHKKGITRPTECVL